MYFIMCRPQSLHRHPRLGPGLFTYLNLALFLFSNGIHIYFFSILGGSKCSARRCQGWWACHGDFPFSHWVTWSWPWCKQCFTGVAAMASEQWPGHALLCQGWPLESLLVNGFKCGLLPTCYCWLPTPIDWLVDREISIVLQWIWCSIILCWVVVS